MITSLAELAPLLAPIAEPRLTWYGPDGERVDLSGRVLANWFVKAANFCALEADLGPGDALWLDLPGHWRTLVWAVGAWTCGARVVVDGADADAVVTATPDERTTAPDVQVVIALPALAMSVSGPLPADALDGVSGLTAQPDDLIVPAQADPAAPALGGASHAELLAGDDAPVASPAERVLLAAPEPGELLTMAPALFARGASIVVASDHHGTADLVAIRAAEGVTVG